MTSFNKLSKFLFTATIQLKPKNIKVIEKKKLPKHNRFWQRKMLEIQIFLQKISQIADMVSDYW